MKTFCKYLLVFWSVIFPLAMGISQESEILKNPQIVGFVDENRDGINDRFLAAIAHRVDAAVGHGG